MGAFRLEQVGVVRSGRPVLESLDWCIPERRISTVLGPSGSGKTSLLRLLNRLDDPESGQVFYKDQPISSWDVCSLRREVGMAFQRPELFEGTVEDNLRMGLFLDPGAWDERLAAVVEIFPLLADRSGQRAGYLSGGERQMVAIGRALMMDPSVLLLDEPSAGLSPGNQDLVFERVRGIADSGVSIVMVEQNARRCLQIADRAYVLDQGRNAHTGPGRDLLHDPRVIDLYLGTLGRVD